MLLTQMELLPLMMIQYRWGVVTQQRRSFGKDIWLLCCRMGCNLAGHHGEGRRICWNSWGRHKNIWRHQSINDGALTIAEFQGRMRCFKPSWFVDVAGQRLRPLHKLSSIATCVNAGVMERKTVISWKLRVSRSWNKPCVDRELRN